MGHGNGLGISRTPWYDVNLWRHLKIYRQEQVINAGDSLEFLSGGFYKATIHRCVLIYYLEGREGPNCEQSRTTSL